MKLHVLMEAERHQTNSKHVGLVPFKNNHRSLKATEFESVRNESCLLEEKRERERVKRKLSFGNV